MKRIVTGPPDAGKPVPVITKGVSIAAGSGFGLMETIVGALIWTWKMPVDDAVTPLSSVTSISTRTLGTPQRSALGEMPAIVVLLVTFASVVTWSVVPWANGV